MAATDTPRTGGRPGTNRLVVRLGALEELPSVVPHLLGFHPRDSLVAVALSGPRERMTFTLRVDLPPEGADRPPVVQALARAVSRSMRRAKADAVLLFVYAAAPEGTGGELPHQDLVEAVMRRSTIRVRDAVLVTETRLWSYLCPDPACCPPEGRPRDLGGPRITALQAAHAMQGQVVLPDRDAAVALVEPLAGVRRVALAQATGRAAEDGFGDRPGSTQQALDFVASLLDRYADPPAEVSDDEAARVVVALHDVLVRDVLLAWWHDRAEAVRGLLFDVVRRAVPPYDAPVCTATAWVAYLDGNGVVARAALDRALLTDPGYSLARLLTAALDGQLPPEELRRFTRKASRALARAAATRGRR